MTDQVPHYPAPASIEGYGRGGFRFAGMSHRGSLLCLPSGIWAWPVARAADIDRTSLAKVLTEPNPVTLLLIGAGHEGWAMPDDLRRALTRAGIAVEVGRTGAAVSTYNILMEERRPVAAALIAVD